MKISIGFLLLFGYSAFVIVAGSDNESEKSIIVSADDFPYIIIDIDLTWKNVLEKLNSLKLDNKDMEKLLNENEVLLRSIDLGGILRRQFIQHCITFHLKRQFVDDEVIVLKEAIKKRLLISMARVECEGSNCDIKSSVESMEPFFQKLESLLNKRFNNDKSHVHKMLQNAKYTIRSRVDEYVTISLCNSKIASFLTKLFTLLDKGLPNDKSYYISKIVTTDKVEELQIEKHVVFKETKDAVNLMVIFQSAHANVEDYLAIPPRNPQQIEFQNLLIHNHCVLKRKIDQIPLDKYVLDDVRQLKLGSFRNKLKIFIDNIFEYREIVDGKGPTSSLTSIDLSEKSIHEKSKTLDNTQFDYLLFMIGGWIEEKVLMSAVSHEMYKPLIRIFHYIENQSDESEEAVDTVLAINWPEAKVKDVIKN